MRLIGLLRVVRKLSLIVFLVILFLSGCATSSQEKESRSLKRGQAYLAKRDYARAVLEFANAVQNAPSDAEAHYQLGLAYIASGAFRDAVSALTKATQLNQGHVGAQIKLAELIAATGNRESIERSRTSIEEILRQSPNNVDALDALAVTEFRLGQWKDAQQAVSQAMRQFPEHLKSSVLAAKIEVASKNFAGAEEILKKAVAQSSGSWEARLALADYYMSARRWADAEAQFRSVLQLQPQNPVGLLGLAATQIELEHSDDAEHTYATLPPDPKYRYIYPSFLVTRRKYQSAIGEFEKLVKADPKDREARNKLVLACLMGNQTNKAQQILTEALRRNPRDTDALTLQGTFLLNNGNYDEAEQKLHQVLSIQRDSDTAHWLLSRLYRAGGNSRQQRLELGEALRINPMRLDARVDFAQNLLAQGDAKAALEELNAAPPPLKNDQGWIAARNWAFLLLGDQEQLSKGLQQGLSLGRTPDLSLQSALLNVRGRDYKAARVWIYQGLQQAPEDPRLFWALAETYVREGQPMQATKQLRDYAAKWPRSARVQLSLGQWFLSAGDRSQAREAFLTARAVDPKFLEADRELAQLDANEGRLEEARKSFTALSAHAEYRLLAETWLANIEDRSHNYSLAAERYRRVLARDPQNVLALNNLAYLLATQTSQFDEALKYAQQAGELAPTSPDVEGTLGWILYRKGLYDNASHYLKDASERDGENKTEGAVVRKYHLAMAYLKAGDRGGAMKVLGKALAANSALPEAGMAQQLLLESP